MRIFSCFGTQNYNPSFFRLYSPLLLITLLISAVALTVLFYYRRFSTPPASLEVYEIKKEIRAALQSLADKGDSRAAFAFAKMCFRGQGGPIDPVDVRTYFKRAADGGHAEAAYWYAYIASLGDAPDTRLQYKRAADLGQLDATCWYAWFCLKGIYGYIDLAEAKRYFEKAAERGHEGAAAQLEAMKPQQVVIEIPRPLNLTSDLPQ